MPSRIKSLLKPVHDRVFDHWVYEVPDGRLRGLRRRGRPSWLRRGAGDDPRLERELAFLESLPLAGKVVFDVGANLGAHGLLLHRMVGSDGEVHLFEPDPHYRRALLDLVLLNDLGRFEVHGTALGSKPGSATLVVPDGTRVRMAGTMSTEFQASLEAGVAQRTVQVRVTSLDRYVDAMGLPDPAFVKIDVEGFELEVVRGASRLLARARPTLMVEVHGLTDAAKRNNLTSILECLAPLDYGYRHLETSSDIDPLGSLPAGGHLIAVPRSTSARARSFPSTGSHRSGDTG